MFPELGSGLQLICPFWCSYLNVEEGERGMLNSVISHEVLNCTGTNMAYDLFTDTFFTLFNLNFPLIRLKPNINTKPLNPFMTRGLPKSRKSKLKLARKAKAQPTEQNKNNFILYRNLYNSLVKRAKNAIR